MGKKVFGTVLLLLFKLNDFINSVLFYGHSVKGFVNTNKDDKVVVWHLKCSIFVCRVFSVPVIFKLEEKKGMRGSI